MKEAIIHFYGFRRDLDDRRRMTTELTAAACRAYDLPKEKVTIYFFDLGPEDTAHAGILEADRPLPAEKT
jgi:hypothetical protein